MKSNDEQYFPVAPFMLCQVVSSFAEFVDEIFKFCHTFLMYCLSNLRLSSVDLQTFTANYFFRMPVYRRSLQSI